MTDRDKLREALAVLIDVFKNPHGTLTPDYGEISGDGFQMMTMHPDPVAVANALSRLPDILATLSTTPDQAVMDERERCAQVVAELEGERDNYKAALERIDKWCCPVVCANCTDNRETARTALERRGSE